MAWCACTPIKSWRGLHPRPVNPTPVFFAVQVSLRTLNAAQSAFVKFYLRCAPAREPLHARARLPPRLRTPSGRARRTLTRDPAAVGRPDFFTDFVLEPDASVRAITRVGLSLRLAVGDSQSHAAVPCRCRPGCALLTTSPFPPAAVHPFVHEERGAHLQVGAGRLQGLGPDRLRR